jgi:hypothetical protein
MLLFRWLMLFLLLGAAVCFVFYAGTGQSRFWRWGVITLKWTLIAALFLFAVFIISRIA